MKLWVRVPLKDQAPGGSILQTSKADGRLKEVHAQGAGGQGIRTKFIVTADATDLVKQWADGSELNRHWGSMTGKKLAGD
ncbi:hypothetical protein ACSYDW_14610 [Paeniglutamicibacter sp. R2-26]|uniref:hypothetical protein n=1 Tax=Paeniglutamicibacter sp. R2-26 TaxID=3144417 RepID=UPI003EE4B209